MRGLDFFYPPLLLMLYRTHCLKLQCHILSVAIAASEAKQYDAPWLKNVGKVMRDAAGRFASKGGTDTQPSPSQGGGVINLPQRIKDIEPADIKESNLLNAITNGFERIATHNPWFAYQIADTIFGDAAAAIRQKIADQYQDISAELASGIRQDPFKEVRDELDAVLNRKDKEKSTNVISRTLGKVILWAKRQCENLVEGLQNLKNNPTVKMVGRLASAAIPLAILLTIPGFGPEVAFPLAFAIESTKLFAGLWAIDATEKALEEADINNRWVATGLSLAAAIAASSAVGFGLKVLGNLLEAGAESGVVLGIQIPPGLQRLAQQLKEKAIASGRQYAENVKAGRTAGSGSPDFKMPTRSELEAQGLKIGGKGAKGTVYFDKAKGIAYKFGDFGRLTSRELEIATIAGEDGFGPKFFGSNREGYAMELLQDHETMFDKLHEIVRSKEKCIEMIRKTLEQTKKMHDAGIVHGDLHTGNIMVSPTGDLKFIDFGFAVKHNPEGIVNGFPSLFGRKDLIQVPTEIVWGYHKEEVMQYAKQVLDKLSVDANSVDIARILQKVEESVEDKVMVDMFSPATLKNIQVRLKPGDMQRILDEERNYALQQSLNAMTNNYRDLLKRAAEKEIRKMLQIRKIPAPR